MIEFIFVISLTFFGTFCLDWALWSRQISVYQATFRSKEIPERPRYISARLVAILVSSILITISVVDFYLGVDLLYKEFIIFDIGMILFGISHAVLIFGLIKKFK